MRLASAAVFDEHLPTLNHLDIVVLRERFRRVQVKERCNTAQNPFNVLSVRLELIGADTVIDCFELGAGVPGSA